MNETGRRVLVTGIRETKMSRLIYGRGEPKVLIAVWCERLPTIARIVLEGKQSEAVQQGAEANQCEAEC